MQRRWTFKRTNLSHSHRVSDHLLVHRPAHSLIRLFCSCRSPKRCSKPDLHTSRRLVFRRQRNRTAGNGRHRSASCHRRPNSRCSTELCEQGILRRIRANERLQQLHLCTHQLTRRHESAFSPIELTCCSCGSSGLTSSATLHPTRNDQSSSFDQIRKS